MDHGTRLDVIAKLRKIATLDFEMNDGDYPNAPYKLIHNGEIYKGEIIREFNSESGALKTVRLNVIRPVQSIGSDNLERSGMIWNILMPS